MILKEQNGKIVYSDGETTEQKMLEIAKNYPEDLSQDFIGNCSEYTANNTFSSVRRNILNWYPFKKDADILEIGAGMGAVTGLLCDVAKSVTSVEMNDLRAEVIRTRYKERKNLEVICADITEWSSEKKFDYVVFIGVLEYADIFLKSDNPYEDFLCSAKKFLKKDGVLLFAIENKTGLKYWVGGSEDHLQEPFAGLKGYTAKSPRTFTKNELTHMLQHVGFNSRRFYYVLPDYKFPEIIATDDYYPNYINLKKVSFTYSKNSILTMDERFLYKDIIENKALDFFANSYLIEASEMDLENTKVVYVSGRGESKKPFRVSTIIYNDGSIYKVPMHREAIKHIETIYDNTKYLQSRGLRVLDYEKRGNSLYCQMYHGTGAQEYFGRMLRENDRNGLFEFIEAFRKELLKSSELIFGQNIFEEMGVDISEYQIGPVLKKGFIDMTLYNSFYDGDTLTFYDQEWCFENIPLNFILYYAINSAYSRLQIETQIKIEEIWNYLNIGKEIILFAKLEEHLWAKVLYRQTDFYGDGGYCNRYNDEITLTSLYEKLDLMVEKNLQLKKENEEREKERNLASQKYAELEQKEKALEIEIKELQKMKALLENSKVKIEEKCNALSEKNELLNIENKELLQEKMDLKQEVLNKEGHIQLLLPPEREYKKIINSKMFKIMRFCCRTFDIVMFIPKVVVKKGIAFIRLLSHVNIPKLKIAWGYVKEEGVRDAYRHLMRDYHQGELKQIQVNVEEKIYDEITSIEKCDVLELPKSEKPMVSIVIPAYNQFTYTYYCIKSILENSGDTEYEIILADDCSKDLTREITSVVKNLIVAKPEKNLLFLRNCNNAAKQAKGKYILFLNNDTQVQKDWLRPLVDLCERDRTIGLVGSKLVYADGTLQEAGGIIWKDGSGWNYGRNDDAMKPEYNYVRDVDYLSGASIMIKRTLWEELGGFDEHFAPAYCEDSDLAFQVRKAGYRVVYQPLSVVVHFEGKSNGTDVTSGIKKYQVENSLKLQQKWKTEFQKQAENGQKLFKARERSLNKKVVLVIDHYVPHYDKDAGSKTTFQYLKMFVQQGYSVKFIGDNFYQHEPYTTTLQQMGIEVLYGPWYAQHWQEWILANKNYIDFAYLNRPHITMKYIDFLKENTDIKCIYYGHDLHFLRLRREYELTGDEKKLEESKEWMEKELYIMRRADISYYPSYIEEQEIHKIDADIPVKAITAYVYEEFLTDIAMDFTKREGIMFVGGFGHPPNEDAVIWFVENVYPLIEKQQNMPFYIIGSNPTERIKKLQKKNIIVKGFVSEEELRELYNTCKVVVVPLRYGAGVKGKVVEALYYGTPMVTTSVGAEGIEGVEEIIEVADTAEKFAEDVLTLYNDNEILAEKVQQYQDFVKNKFGVEAVWDIIKEDFK